ncbi:MAG: thermostable hemolysin [Candidatus Kaiserbacteria bacterium]|nr:thermostable hemolysin [Candidatus Kaiserbacteria bacterium]MCB9816869.1 thermostable hemolysin [Candidatus Nomurabacteria bacterium]
MKSLELITPEHAQHKQVVSFVNSVYERTLHVSARNPPETLLAAIEGENVFGCIGFNHSVQWHFFKDDPRYQRAVSMFPSDTRIGEQSMLAISGFPAGVPLLFSALAAYAEHVGIQKIVFAGIGVSCRTVEQLGFSVDVLGPTAEAVTSPQDRAHYAYWLEQFQPQTCILDTTRAQDVYHNVAGRFTRKAHLAPSLQAQLAA